MTLAPCGGIVLCGGQSTRMGRPKLALPFADELLVQRMVRLLQSVVSPVVVVAAPGQDVPDVGPEAAVLRDDAPGQGPLAGMVVGLEHLGARGVPAAYVSACDTPLLRGEFIRRMVDWLGDAELAVPFEGEFPHPLAGVYRTGLATRIRGLLAEGRRRPLFLIEESRSRRVPVDSLRDVDPELESLRNANTREEFAALASRATGPLDVSRAETQPGAAPD